MDVTGPGSVQGAFPVRPTQKPSNAKPTIDTGTTGGPKSVRDEVEISSAGRMMESLNQSSEVRSQRLDQIRTAIEAGTYDTPERLEAALDKMLREIGIGNE